jgi:hypothetical protein
MRRKADILGSVEKVTFAEKLALFDEHWSPKIVGEPNGQHVKLVTYLGEFIVVPRGVEHRPVAEEEVSVMLFEPASTMNTGNVTGEMTVAELDRI